jgi:transcriptional regulator with XRE-family HTH domain
MRRPFEQMLEQRTPFEIAEGVALNVRRRRKERGLTQAGLAKRAGVSLGSLKRFEQSFQISLHSLAKIAIALDAEDGFGALFEQRYYRSIQDVIDATASARRDAALGANPRGGSPSGIRAGLGGEGGDAREDAAR